MENEKNTEGEQRPAQDESRKEVKPRSRGSRSRTVSDTAQEKVLVTNALDEAEKPAAKKSRRAAVKKEPVREQTPDTEAPEAEASAGTKRRTRKKNTEKVSETETAQTSTENEPREEQPLPEKKSRSRRAGSKKTAEAESGKETASSTETQEEAASGRRKTSRAKKEKEESRVADSVAVPMDSSSGMPEESPAEVKSTGRRRSSRSRKTEAASSEESSSPALTPKVLDLVQNDAALASKSEPEPSLPSVTEVESEKAEGVEQSPHGLKGRRGRRGRRSTRAQEKTSDTEEVAGDDSAKHDLTDALSSKSEPAPLVALEPEPSLPAETEAESEKAEGIEQPAHGSKGKRGRHGRRSTRAQEKTSDTEDAAEDSSDKPGLIEPFDALESVPNADESIESDEELLREQAEDTGFVPGEGDAESGRHPHRGRESAQTQRKTSRKMFFSVLAGERIEVALSCEGKLCEYYLDMQHQKKLKGNIYKGIIQNIDTNLQAAFVNYGTMKNGFLQIDEIHSEYWLAHYEPTKGNKFPPIQKVIKPGQEVLVQVVKEPTGNKGAFLTTWLSLAGRFLVLTPGQEQIGVSRKVVDEAERARLKELINGIDPGENIGVIVRTVSAGTTKTTLKNDLQYLKRIWKEILNKGKEMEAPALIYSEPSLIERAVRDYLTEDVTEIWVDDEGVAETVRNMVNLLFPRKKDLVHLFNDKRQGLWDRFNLRRQIEQINSREVFLPSGGRLVFDQTEALMAVDVNSGKISCKGNFEAMAYKTNMEAAESIAKQLRLRDVGGQVVIDFIEMRDRKHVEDVERNLRLAMKADRARYDIEHMSSFGLLELVRQRTGFSALSITQEPCPHCGGTGQRRNLEWQSLQMANDIQRQMRSSRSAVCVVEAGTELGMYLLNHKREMLQELEEMYGKKLEIRLRPSQP